MTVLPTARAKLWLGLAGLIGLVVAWIVLQPAPRQHDSDAPASSRSPSAAPNAGGADALSSAAFSTSSSPAGLPSLAEQLEETLRILREGRGRAAARQALARLKEAIHAASPTEAAASLIAMLESGQDVATDLAFVVGPDGVMEETPTWRTALLDLLGQTEPWMAADYARRILASTGSADEYALALRNLAWSDQGNLKDELRGHFRVMLARPDWRMEPTRGFLEAFDIAVISGAVGELGSVVHGSPDVEAPESRAAFVALDRIMLRDPALLVEAFARDAAFLAHAPMHRASLLSRLDVREPAQAHLLADYLLRPEPGAEEREYFADLFPNGNRFTSHRLVTAAEPGGGIHEMQQVDVATHQVLSAWREEPRFSPRAAELNRILQRLESYLKAGSGP